jgi:hypothetical protein
MIFAVHQPNFLPWMGYFAKIAASDVFVFLDDAQMPQGRSVVSRVLIRKGEESGWLTVPVNRHASDEIRTVRLDEGDWRKRHFAILRDRYGKAPHFDEVVGLIAPAYETDHDLLADFNSHLIGRFCDWLGFETRRVRSSDVGVCTKSDVRLADIGKALGADTYLSGSGAGGYQSEETFTARGIALKIANPMGAWEQVDGVNPRHSLFEMACILGREQTAEIITGIAERMT